MRARSQRRIPPVWNGRTAAGFASALQTARHRAPTSASPACRKRKSARGVERSVVSWNRPDLWCRVVAEVDHDLVDIAPAPAFGRIVALYDGVLGRMKMFGGVLAVRLIATPDMTAGPADAKVKPLASGFEALLAAPRLRLHFLDRAGVLALVHD